MTRNRNTGRIRAPGDGLGKDVPPLVSIMGNAPPAGARTRWIVAKDGTVLRAAFWRPSNAHGSLLVIPGRTEFLEIYFETVREALAMGLATGVIDWRRQGLNERVLADPRKGHVEQFADYQMDAEAYADAAKAEGMPRPWFLLAHSMGAAIACRHVTLSAHPPEGLVLLAPMLGLALGGLNSRLAEAVASIAVRVGLGESYVPGVDRRTVMERGFAGNPLTSDEGKFNMVHDLNLADPALALGGPTWRWFREALRNTRHLRRQPPLDVPILAILADRDRVVDNRKARAVLQNAGDVRIHVLADCLHCPLLERTAVRRQVYSSIRAFVEAKV